jgi:hypothetical protein
MSGRGGRRRSSERGRESAGHAERLAGDRRSQSNLVGVVLLIGFVVTTAAVTLAIGSLAVSDLQTSVDVENSIQTMREVDSRLSRVAYSDNTVETLEFGRSNDVSVYNESLMNITVNREGAHCSADISMGSIVRESDDGTEIAYEGGGVWRLDDSGSTMVSPPDFQYENGTINFPVVSVNGSVSPSGGQLIADKNTTESVRRSRKITKRLTAHPACENPTNLTISVESRHYEAWGRYFEQVTPANASTYEGNETAEIVLATRGDPTTAQIDANNVTASGDFVAEFDILATEGSVPSHVGWTSFSYGGPGRAELNDPMTFRVVKNGTTKTPWRDGDPDDASDPAWDDDISMWGDDVNQPGDYDPANVLVEAPANTNLSVEAAIHDCEADGDYDDLGMWRSTGRVETWNGNDYHQYVCDVSDPGRVKNDIQVRIDSSQSNDYNLEILKDDDVVPGDHSDKEYQRGLRQVLGRQGLMDNSSYEMELKDNQVVFVYELSSDVPSASAQSGYDFNDAILLATVYEQGNAAVSGSFSIKVSANEIQIKE